MNREDLAAKTDWEGGVAESIFSYGLKSADLPKNAPSSIKQAWQRVEAVKDDVHAIEKWLFGDL